MISFTTKKFTEIITHRSRVTIYHQENEYTVEILTTSSELGIEVHEISKMQFNKLKSVVFKEEN